MTEHCDRPAVPIVSCAGQDGKIRRSQIKLSEVMGGRSTKGMLLLGSPQSGKSAFLTRIKEIADAHGSSMITRSFGCTKNGSMTNKLVGIVDENHKVNSWRWWFSKWFPRTAANKAVCLGPASPVTSLRFVKRLIVSGNKLKSSNKCLVISIDDFHEASIEDHKAMFALFHITLRENLPILFVVAANRSLCEKLRQEQPTWFDSLECHTLGRLTEREVRAAPA